MALTKDQITKLTPKLNRPTRSLNLNDWGNPFNPAYEETLAGMFGRVDEPLDNFPPDLVALRSSLFAPVIGRKIQSDEIPAVLSLASQVTNPNLASRCLYALEQIVLKEKFADKRVALLLPRAERILSDLEARFPDVVQARETIRKKFFDRNASPQ